MKESTKLTIQMSLLFLIIFVSFGVIIVNERISPLRIPKVKEKTSAYLSKNYENILNEVSLEETEYKNLRYQTKVTSNKNKNWYFYIFYENKTFTDTYTADFIEGKTIIEYQENNIRKNIKAKTNTECKANIEKTFDKYTKPIQEQILNSQKLESTKIYTLEIEFKPSIYKSEKIASYITNLSEKMRNKNITPKHYSFIITDSKDETHAIKISNITDDIIKLDNFENIISDILNDKKNSTILNTYNIKYEFLN